jgi:hypothetical protein
LLGELLNPVARTIAWIGAPVIFLQKVVLANGRELETKKGF